MPEKSPIKISEIRGSARLITEATLGITNLVEKVHRQSVYSAFLTPYPIQSLITGISSITYNSIRLSTKIIGGGLEKIMQHIDPDLDSGVRINHKEAIISALNGIIGDHLEESRNSLAIPMQFRFRGNKIPSQSESIAELIPDNKGRILLMIHGLCMNDTLWNRKDHDHGEKLANELGFSPIYLHYNSGRHISTNGQELSYMLDELLNNWPTPVSELVILSHSMGGLLARSATHYASQGNKSWAKSLKKLVFLGTPHQGARLEQLGNYINQILHTIPQTRPFSSLSNMRSAGITDLRYGSIVDEDWQGENRFAGKPNSRQTILLPEHINHYNIAACMSKKDKQIKAMILGDGLVTLDSALGVQSSQDECQSFKKSNTWISYENNHMDLLSDQNVYLQIKKWLT